MTTSMTEEVNTCCVCGNTGPGKIDFYAGGWECVYCESAWKPVLHIEVGKFYDGGYWIKCPEMDYSGTGPEKWGVLDNFLEYIFYAENPDKVPFSDWFDGLGDNFAKNPSDTPYLSNSDSIKLSREKMKAEVERLQGQILKLQSEVCKHVNIENFGDIRACPDCGWSGTFTYQEQKALREKAKKQGLL